MSELAGQLPLSNAYHNIHSKNAYQRMHPDGKRARTCCRDGQQGTQRLRDELVDVLKQESQVPTVQEDVWRVGMHVSSCRALVTGLAVIAQGR